MKSNNPSSPSNENIPATYESCVSQLTGGKPITSLSTECQKLLGVVNLILTRRNSQGPWDAKSGHNSRNYEENGVVGGPSQDRVSDQEKELSVSELYLRSKSPKDQEMIKQKMARTASRGGKVRSEGIISPEDIEKERQKLEKEKKQAREAQ